jgi:predicted ArsR family transcriptional regulator
MSRIPGHRGRGSGAQGRASLQAETRCAWPGRRKGIIVNDRFSAEVAGISALAEPARRTLYLYVADQPDPVSREQAASACGLPLHTAKFHLDRLVDEGLLDVTYRRLTGRTGPGAGRTAKLYQRSDREVSVSLPERRYDLAGDILAAAIDRSTAEGISVREAVEDAAASRGRALAAAAEPGEGGDLERSSKVLDQNGYEPRLADGDLCLANCPFDRLAREHTELVCGMNVALVRGVLDGLGCESLEAVLEPAPGLCCVKARHR